LGAIDIVASPALGGVVPGYETARWLGAKATSFEREDGVFPSLRRGFKHSSRRARADGRGTSSTTGLSSRETLAALAEHPGTIVGAACLISTVPTAKRTIGVQARGAWRRSTFQPTRPTRFPPNWRRFRRSNRASRALAGPA